MPVQQPLPAEHRAPKRGRRGTSTRRQPNPGLDRCPDECRASRGRDRAQSLAGPGERDVAGDPAGIRSPVGSAPRCRRGRAAGRSVTLPHSEHWACRCSARACCGPWRLGQVVRRQPPVEMHMAEHAGGGEALEGPIDRRAVDRRIAVRRPGRERSPRRGARRRAAMTQVSSATRGLVTRCPASRSSEVASAARLSVADRVMRPVCTRSACGRRLLVGCRERKSDLELGPARPAGEIDVTAVRRRDGSNNRQPEATAARHGSAD